MKLLENIRRVALLLTPILLTVVVYAEAPTEWNQWRGPTRDGKFVGPTWPADLKDAHFKSNWHIELGESYSGPIVTVDAIFVTETEKKSREVVRKIDRKSGQEIWRAQWDGAMTVPFFARENGDWIRSTPAFDGELLYVAGMRDVLVALDVKTGAERWRIDFVERFKSGLPAFGFVCSPIVVGNDLYVQAGGGFCKLNKKTGEILWRTLAVTNPMMGSAFSSPVFVQLGGKSQLVVQTRDKLCGVDPATGKVLWSQLVPAFRDMNILTPIIHEGGAFTSAYGGKSFFYKIDGSEDSFTVKEAWNNKHQGYMSTPVVIAGYAYMHLRNQRVTCLELATGKEMWTTTQRFGKYWSMIAQDDRILALDERGMLYLLKASPKEFIVLDSRKVSDQETWAHLAMVGKELFIRELKGLSSYTWSAD